MILGHRHSVPIRLTLDTNHLGGRWPLFLADHRITEVYGHNQYGNAIYIIDDDWERLSRLTKRKLLTHPEATRIVHKGKWYWKVKQELEFDDA